MPIDAPLSVRASEEAKRDAGREAAIQYFTTRAYARRDARVEEAKAALAQRPPAEDRAPEAPQRRPKPSSGGGMVDVLA